MISNKQKSSDDHEIITAYGLKTRVWTFNQKTNKYGCAECCNGDRCDEDCTAKYKGGRSGCPHCKGRGWIPASAVTPS